MIDNTLFEIERATWRSSSKFANWALYAITRYVNTGRASSDWCKALAKANPDKLLDKMLHSKSLSDDDMLKTCTAYLKRYAGLKP